LSQQKQRFDVTHARITMCILTFSSVLPALMFKVLRPLSRFPDGKSPDHLCEPSRNYPFTLCSRFLPFLLYFQYPQLQYSEMRYSPHLY